MAAPISLIKEKRKCFPEKVILCASGKINDAARDYIVEELKDPRIAFLDADDLIPLVDDHFPELWLDIDVDLFPYFKALRALVEQKSDDHAIGESALRGNVLATAASDAAFVPLSVFRNTLKRRVYHGQVTNVPSLEELPIVTLYRRRERRVLLSGDAGSGKSTALLRIAYEIINRGVTTEKEYRVPVLVRAIDIAIDKPTSLLKYCADISRDLAKAQKAAFSTSDLREGRVHILVDALDEIPESSAREGVLALIEDFAREYPRVQIIISSRPGEFVRSSPILTKFETFNICPIDFRQAEKIIRGWQKGDEALASKSAHELVRRLEQVHGMELNPLLVTVFAATTDYSRQDIPANITELFKKFTELMLGRWDETKGMAHQYHAPLKDHLLTKIAFEMHRNKQSSLRKKDFDALLREELDRMGHRPEMEQLLDELLNRSGLFRIIGESVEFRHHMLQEFFAGRGIGSVDFIKHVITDEWWKRPIVFYFGEHPDKIEALAGVMSSVTRTISSEKLFEAATTVGLATQACYLSRVDEKVNVWKWVASALSVSRTGALQEADKDGKYPLTSFIGHYLYGRDAVALSHVRDHVEELTKWAKESAIADKEDEDAKMFWLIAALVEIDELQLANELLKKFHPKELRFLLGINVGAFLAKEIRVGSRANKELAEVIIKRLEEKVAPLRAQLRSEFGSHLLELREGKIAAIPDGEKAETTQKPLSKREASRK